MTKKTLNLTIGKRIRKLRNSLGMTRKKLAERLEITVSHMGLIERGDRGLTMWNCMLLCEALCVSPEYILTGHNELPDIKNIDVPNKTQTTFSEQEWEHFKDLITAYSLISPAKRNADIIFESLNFSLSNYTKTMHHSTTLNLQNTKK